MHRRFSSLRAVPLCWGMAWSKREGERERERRFVKCMADFDAAGRTFILSDFTLSDIKASDSTPYSQVVLLTQLLILLWGVKLALSA